MTTVFYEKGCEAHCHSLIGNGDGGIRTHVPLQATRFRVELVMTSSIRLHLNIYRAKALKIREQTKPKNGICPTRIL